jgi:putative transposase
MIDQLLRRFVMLIGDVFTVETLRLHTLYVLFFIDRHARRVHLAGCTTSPENAWVTEWARQYIWGMSDPTLCIGFHIHDQDRELSTTFD